MRSHPHIMYTKEASHTSDNYHDQTQTQTHANILNEKTHATILNEKPRVQTNELNTNPEDPDKH